MTLRCLALSGALLALCGGAHAETVTLRFTGAEPEGAVLVALFGSETDFRADRPLATARARAKGGAASARFQGLALGTYALKVFQDTDGNGRLSVNALGIPKEPYAFSNNARGRFGPPGWAKAAFALDAGGAGQTIRLD